MVQLRPWLHSTFKELSNDTSHAQIRVKMKKLCLDSECVTTLVATMGVSRHWVLLSNLFSSLTCRGHNFFILTQIWVCGMSFESSLNVK